MALDIRDQQNDIWIGDLARQTLTRLTDAPAFDQYPVWTPDSRRVISKLRSDYQSDQVPELRGFSAATL